jgi:hypothetical protein
MLIIPRYKLKLIPLILRITGRGFHVPNHNDKYNRAHCVKMTRIINMHARQKVYGESWGAAPWVTQCVIGMGEIWIYKMADRTCPGGLSAEYRQEKLISASYLRNGGRSIGCWELMAGHDPMPRRSLRFFIGKLELEDAWLLCGPTYCIFQKMSNVSADISTEEGWFYHHPGSELSPLISDS